MWASSSPRLPDQVQTSAQQVPCGSHRRGIDVGLGQHPAPEQHRDLVRVDLVVLRFTAVNRFHGERVAQDERDVLGRAEVREPVPREHTLGGHGEIGTVRPCHFEERRRRGRHVPVHEHLARRVQDADVHRLHV